MVFRLYSVLFHTIAVNYCTGFYITYADEEVVYKRLYGEQTVDRALQTCTNKSLQLGFNILDMTDYAGRFTERLYSENFLFDCSWACFFLEMGWLDWIEGTYLTSAVLRNLEDYIPADIIEHAKIVASRCNYVNFPRPAPPGRAPYCGQARLLKECLILENPVPAMTAEYKAQVPDFLVDWLWTCAMEEHAELDALLAHVRRGAGRRLPEYGCALKCLLLDMGWMDDDPKGRRMLLPSVVAATVARYYGADDRTPQMIEGASHCVLDANGLVEDGEFYPDTGCHRAMFLVQCLAKIFVL